MKKYTIELKESDFYMIDAALEYGAFNPEDDETEDECRVRLIRAFENAKLVEEGN